MPQLSLAQTDRAQTIDTQIEVSEPVTNTTDITRPELKAAYEALTKAEREFLEAARSAQETQAATSSQTPSVKPDDTAALNIDTSGIQSQLLSFKDNLLRWLTSIPFLLQLGAIILAFILAPIFAVILRKSIFLFSKAPSKDAKFFTARDYMYRARIFLRGAVNIGLLAVFALILKSLPMGAQDWLVKIAQGLVVVFLLYKAIREFVPNALLQKILLWSAIPSALLMVFGYFDEFQSFLNNTELMTMGGTPITAMTIILLLIFGAVFFKLGGIVNSRGQDAIRSQEELDVTTREVIAKIFQILLYAVIFVLVLGAAKVPLSGLVVIFSALSLGIGLGLQPIAANFVSGMIILFDRSVRKGDYVVLPDGQEGFVDAINMRSTTVETTDGKDIMVPNTTFTEGVYENWTHKDPRQRYEVYFMVAYDTDIDRLEGLLIPAISEHPKVLQEPEKPDLELREFGDFGIKFAIEFWASGIDDGPNKFTSDLNFIVWRTLKTHGIEMPLPQREVRMLK